MTETVLYPRKRPRMYTPERDTFLRENTTLDAALLAEALGMTIRTIYCYQRRLGIRPCANHLPKQERITS